MDNLDETAARLGEYLKNCGMGEWSVFTKNDAGHQEIVADDPNDEIPWTVAQFPPSEAFADGIVLMKNALPALLAERSADKAEMARLRGALESLVQSTGEYVSTGSDKAGYAEMVMRMKRDVSLARVELVGPCEHQSQPGPCSVCGDMG